MFDNERLKELRKSKGYTQEEMAEALGYASKSGYSMLESGEIGINLEKAQIISKMFDMSIEDIFLTSKSN